MRSVVIIGSGNVAEAFARVLPERGFEVRQIFARNPERGRAVAQLAQCEWSDNPDHIATAELYLVAVSDSAITPLLSSLVLPEGAVVAHTAGSQPLEAIPSGFPRRAVIYPLQTFTAGRVVDFGEIPLFIEASDQALLAEIRAIAEQLSGMVIEADSQMRSQAHISGVVVCNFVNHLYAVGAELMRSAGLPFATLSPLIAETARKAIESGNPSAVQTGPARRNDRTTIERHLRMLEQNPELQDIYEKLSQNIWKETSKRD
ncbi:MAG: DUF2520 domain-containing protein [Alistipes sp.]|nr:DUF2520 domain-containing protein [Alistipes sp.]